MVWGHGLPSMAMLEGMITQQAAVMAYSNDFLFMTFDLALRLPAACAHPLAEVGRVGRFARSGRARGDGLSYAGRAISSTRSARRSRRVRNADRFRRRRRRLELRGRGERVAQDRGQPLGRELGLRHDGRAAGLARAPPHSPPDPDRAHAETARGRKRRPMTASSETVEAPARPMTRWAAAIRAGRSGKNSAISTGKFIRAQAAATRALSSPRACWVRRIHCRSSGLKSAIAAGTTSAMTRAPCEPPVTRRFRRCPTCSG